MNTSTAILRFAGSMERDPAIASWLAVLPDDLARTADRWFTVMRTCGPDVKELMHDGLATVCVDDAPFAYVGAFTAHVNVGFFHGASLPDPARLLMGSGRHMRHVRVVPNSPMDERALETLITAAHHDIVARVHTTP